MRDEDAVSPVVGTLLILATFSVVVTAVIAVGRPQIVEYQERGEFQTVVNQMGRVVNTMKQLSISGSLSEVAQPTMRMPNGDLQIGQGHHVAVSIGYLDPDYGTVDGSDADPWAHAAFHIEPVPPATDWGPDAAAVQVRWTADLLDRNMVGSLQRWDGQLWETVDTTPAELMSTNEVFPLMTFQDSSGNPLTLADGTWRFLYHERPLIGDDVLRGEVYLYDQTQMMYRYSGESGPRAAFGENGALFVYEHNQYRLTRPSLLAAPDGNAGGNVLTVRAATVSSETGSASGRTDIGFLLRVADTETWVRTGGAMVVRLQFAGPFEDLWYKHLEERGFAVDATPARGVYHVDDDTTADKHTVFPVNMMWSELDLKVRVG